MLLLAALGASMLDYVSWCPAKASGGADFLEPRSGEGLGTETTPARALAGQLGLWGQD